MHKIIKSITVIFYMAPSPSSVSFRNFPSHKIFYDQVCFSFRVNCVQIEGRQRGTQVVVVSGKNIKKEISGGFYKLAAFRFSYIHSITVR